MQKTQQTPMLRQYLDIKKKYPGIILFFRLGDFYELFFEDAQIGARVLGITLTARHKDSPHPVPMCGVPHHAASSYINKLIKSGYRVAVCEQIKDSSDDSKLVRREVVKVITPGTAFNLDDAESRESVYLAAIAKNKNVYGASLLELGTGEFITSEFSGEQSQKKAIEFIKSYQPNELIFAEELRSELDNEFRNLNNNNYISLSDAQHMGNDNNVVPIFSYENRKQPVLTHTEDWFFEFEQAEKLLLQQFAVKSLKAFGIESKKQSIRSAGACLKYVQETQKSTALHISEIKFIEQQDYLILDALTIKNLNIFADSNQSLSLFSLIDETVTGMGSRLLKGWLHRPLLRISEIKMRQSAVAEFCQPILRENFRRLMRDVSDLERLTGKLSLDSITARDLLVLAKTLKTIPKIKSVLANCETPLIEVLRDNITDQPAICDLIDRSIAEEPPANISDGGTIRQNFSEELDRLVSIGNESKQLIASYEELEKKRTGIANLRIKFTGVFGYFIEISKSNIAKIPDDYERRQTLTNAERYTTPQLKDWERNVLGADERIRDLELEIFKRICQQVAAEIKNLQITARALSTLDTLQAFAQVAANRQYVPPTLTEGDELIIKNGRHPIVEAQIGDQFIPNDVYLNNSTDRLLIITGPNMGGKSTVLRQTALIQILAQIGSFVPASEAVLPLVDRIWTRVGAADDLSSGRSTFMVEMTETAEILHNATPRSLVIIDELGRGTSTFDGLSIAWAVAEYLHNSPQNAAKTLFATHYYELTELARLLPGAKNFQITATESGGELVFLHKLEPGSASKSYGIAVASLAGLPKSVVNRSKEVLSRLEEYELAVFSDKDSAENEQNLDNSFTARSIGNKKALQQFSLFAVSNETVVNELREVDFASLPLDKCLQKILEIQSKII